MLLLVVAVGCSGPAAPTTLNTTTTLVLTTTTTPTPITTTTLIPSTTSTPEATSTLATTTTQATTTSQATTTTVTAGASQLIWKANTSEPVVSLTFDAGSDRGFAEEILDYLSHHAISVTFGMTGVWAETNPDLVKRMVDEGHTLMNHTYNHPHMETLSTAERVDQLERTERIIVDLTGTSTVPYFRPPYGAYNNQVLADVGAAGYRYSIMWTVDSLGWKGLPAPEVAERTLSGAEPGAIILLHVGAKSTDFEALPSIVSGLRDAGYQFVTIPELIP